MSWDDVFGPYDSPPPTHRPGRPPRRQRSWGAVSGGLLVVALMFGYLQWTTDGALFNRLRALVGFEQPRADGEYTFLSTQPGSDDPVTWRCGPIPVEVNTVGAPREWRELLDEAGDRVVEAGGPRFEFTGTTADRDFAGRQGWVRQPVLLGWAKEEDEPDLAGDVVGYAGPTGLSTSGASHYRSGAVVLEQEFFDRADWASARAVVMHELAHVVGLGHVESAAELMHAENWGVEEFGPGDRAGLRTLGSLRCP